MQYSSEVPANSCDLCTHSLQNVKNVNVKFRECEDGFEKCAKAIEKNCKVVCCHLVDTKPTFPRAKIELWPFPRIVKLSIY